MIRRYVHPPTSPLVIHSLSIFRRRCFSPKPCNPFSRGRDASLIYRAHTCKTSLMIRSRNVSPESLDHLVSRGERRGRRSSRIARLTMFHMQQQAAHGTTFQYPVNKDRRNRECLTSNWQYGYLNSQSYSTYKDVPSIRSFDNRPSTFGCSCPATDTSTDQPPGLTFSPPPSTPSRPPLFPAPPKDPLHHPPRSSICVKQGDFRLQKLPFRAPHIKIYISKSGYRCRRDSPRKRYKGIETTGARGNVGHRCVGGKVQSGGVREARWQICFIRQFRKYGSMADSGEFWRVRAIGVMFHLVNGLCIPHFSYLGMLPFAPEGREWLER